MSHYDFRTLSPLDFEELVRDLLQAEFSLRFESFGPGQDLGIDFRFASASGHTIVQAKHYAESGFDALVTAAKREDAKVEKLKPTRYLLATSVSLNPVKKSKVKAALPSAPITLGDIYGREDLNNLLGRHPEIEKKHFKLWGASTAVLERIIHSGVYNRTQAEMDEIRTVVPKFVQNDSVQKAQAVLEKAGSLIIAGEPGVGKSTLARMLIWMHAQQGWSVSVIDDIADAFALAHQEGARRLVFFDDFLGQIRLTPDWIRTVDQRLPPLLQRTKSAKSLRFIMTTRDYVLHQAQMQSERLSGAAFRLSEFTLNIGFYTRTIKARMLFNHIFFSDLVASDRQALLDDDFFLDIIKHRNFNPRIIGLLSSADYISLVDRPIRAAVNAVLENPQILWEKPYRSHITDDGRALMLALFFNSDRVPVAALERTFARISTALGHNIPQGDLPARFRAALKELEGSVVAIESRTVSFSNPGIQDFLQRAVAEDRLLPMVIGVVEEFAELEQTWSVCCAQTQTPATIASMADAWAGAALRLLDTHSGSPLKRLAILIDLYDRLQTDQIAELTDRAVDELKGTEIEGVEADRVPSVLEQLSLTLLPQELLNKAREAVTGAVATMLRDYGPFLSLDTIKSVTESLFEHGSDEDSAADASKSALEGYLNDLRSVLSEMTSLDEIDTFEQELKALMNDYDVMDRMVAFHINNRRDELLERENFDYDADSRWSPPASPGHMSDDDIRSLFGALRED